MNEARRQWYLKALGLTPWVARMPLPGAAASPALDWQEETDSAPGQTPPTVPAGEVVAEATPVASPQRPADPRPAPQPPEPAVEAPRTETPPEPEPAADAQGGKAVPAGATLTFTLEAHLAGDTWVVFEQEDAQAPGLGRYGAPLAAALLALFGAAPQRPRRFYCPLTADQPMNPEAAEQALRAFFDGLIRQGGGERILLCLDEAHVRALFDGERYRAFTLGQRPALAVSTLAEMLAAPAQHKRLTWQAMQAAGFAGSAA